MKESELSTALMPFLAALALYHRYEVIGLERIPRNGAAIIACTHSLATYDIGLLMYEVYEQLGRFPRSLIDRLFYKIPGLGEIMESLGSVMGSQDNALDILNNGELLYIAPGGMRESLRPSDERYQTLWEQRKGFVRLSIESGAPIVLAACPKADDIYDVFPNPITKWFYKTLKVPVFLARGFGPTLLPKPVKLRHFVSEPIKPPKKRQTTKAFELQVEHHHKLILERMKILIADAVAYREGSSLLKA